MKADKPDHDEIMEALREVFPAVDAHLRRDLWPAMLGRIQREEAGAVPWYDWVLAAAVLAMAVLFPKIALLFAYHL